jgi:hypothetical protein
VLLLFVRQVFECRGGILARQQPEDDHLVFDRQVAQHRRQALRRSIADDVAQLGVVARADDGGEFITRSRRPLDGTQRLVAPVAFELFGHLRQRRSHHVVVVHVWPNRLDSVEPHLVDEIEIAG